MTALPFSAPRGDKQPVFIYGLVDPSGRVNYVGQTEFPQSRAQQHSADRRRMGERLLILGRATWESRIEVERAWIELFADEGLDNLDAALLPYSIRDELIQLAARIGASSRLDVPLRVLSRAMAAITMRKADCWMVRSQLRELDRGGVPS